MKNRLAKYHAVIQHEYDNNPEFRTRMDQALGGKPEESQNSEPSRRSRNKRASAVIDPYREFAGGEEQLLKKLEPLTIDQLKDIVSEHALDSSRRALKWKSKERLIELIVTTTRNRIQKGDVFRGEGKGERKAEGEDKTDDDNKGEVEVE